MPRITEERRSANRQAIVDAARRCFARDGFHQTSMPDLLAEAGISAGAFYRYFAGKEDLIREIAREAFGALGVLLATRLGGHPGPSVADVVALVVETLAADEFTIGDRTVDTDEQFRVAVQAWGEVLRDEALAEEAGTGIGRVVDGIAAALERGRAAGRVPAALDPHDGARFVVAIAPGLIMQRIVLRMDPRAVGRAAEVLLNG